MQNNNIVNVTKQKFKSKAKKKQVRKWLDSGWNVPDKEAFHLKVFFSTHGSSLRKNKTFGMACTMVDQGHSDDWVNFGCTGSVLSNHNFYKSLMKVSEESMP